MINKDKKYQTRDGHDVRLYATDCGGKYPVHGAWLDDDGEWLLDGWSADGHWCRGMDSKMDLIEVTPERVVWINEYAGHCGSAYSERREADSIAGSDRIALHRVVLGKDTRVDD